MSILYQSHCFKIFYLHCFQRKRGHMRHLSSLAAAHSSQRASLAIFPCNLPSFSSSFLSFSSLSLSCSHQSSRSSWPLIPSQSIQFHSLARLRSHVNLLCRNASLPISLAYQFAIVYHISNSISPSARSATLCLISFFSRIFPTNDTTHESCLYPIPNALHCHSHKASIRITLSYALT